ncbi:transcription factor EC-like [Mercenaria mercenaria]|uniref:transcription factor EC-like n=1 Tax=Mercenaria mercenaria TaxID=6596 RepID=UPI00234F3BC8|nr:transcription factor EC-like [Mercenaria mercenaria]
MTVSDDGGSNIADITNASRPGRNKTIFNPNKLISTGDHLETVSTHNLSTICNAIFSDNEVPNHTSKWTNENVDDMCPVYGLDTTTDDVVRKRYKTENSIMDDQLAELQSILPGHIDRVSWQTHDSILKASVDYIKMHRHDHDRIQQLKDKMRECDLEIRKMLLRVERLQLRTAISLTKRRGPDVMKQ